MGRGAYSNKPLLIICFSSTKSKALAHNIIQNQDFQSIYPFTEVYYLDCGIMEVFNSGFEPVSSIQNTLNYPSSSPIDRALTELKLKFLSHQRRQTYAIASNTLVEAPHIDKFLHNVIDSINIHAKQNHIPFEVIQVKPSLKDDFWVNLIGKGYPSPTRTFRWCTVLGIISCNAASFAHLSFPLARYITNTFGYIPASIPCP